MFRVGFLHSSATQNSYVGVEKSAISSTVQFMLGCHMVTSCRNETVFPVGRWGEREVSNSGVL